MFQPDTARRGRSIRSIDSNLPYEYCQGNLRDDRRLAIFCNTVALYLVKDFALMAQAAPSSWAEVDNELLAYLPRVLTFYSVHQLVYGMHQDSLEVIVTPTTIRVAALRSY